MNELSSSILFLPFPEDFGCFACTFFGDFSVAAASTQAANNRG